PPPPTPPLVPYTTLFRSNSTRMHVWTHLKKESIGRTGVGLYADGMVEHDDMVGRLLAKIDALKLTENTIVVYGTDNGAETATWRSEEHTSELQSLTNLLC